MENKILISTKTRRVDTERKFIGVSGENNVEKLVFSFTEFVDGIAWLEIERKDEKGFIQMTKVEETYELPVLSSLLTQEGYIKMQVRITKTDNINSPLVFKSETFTIKVKEAINATKEIPEEYPSWIDIANSKIEEIDKLINDVQTKLENGEFDGVDGLTPYIQDSFWHIGNAVTGKMAKYRQELRDIPQQEGFPYNVEFPQKPNANDEREEKE